MEHIVLRPMNRLSPVRHCCVTSIDTVGDSRGRLDNPTEIGGMMVVET